MSTKFLVIILLLPALNAMAQDEDTTYFDGNGNAVNSLALADYYEVIQHDHSDSNKVTDKIFSKSGQTIVSQYYSDYKNKLRDGLYELYYENGQIQRKIDFKSGKYNGKLLTYWENGKPKRIDSFHNDIFIRGKCFNADGKVIAHTDFQKMPEFPGGMSALQQFLMRSVKYPNKARKKGIEGEVILEFVVNTNGSISGIKIIQSVNDELDKEAIRVVKKMPKWKPGMQDGEVVNVSFTLPIRFELEDAH